MDRRAFIAGLGGAAARPLVARGQQTERVRRIGVLTFAAESDQEGQSSVAAFREELRKLGWMEGRNVTIDVRWAAGDVEAMKRFARELVALQPDLIFTSSTPATAATLQATRTIPVVFVLVADPVGSGFVASQPRPGGNATGFATIELSLGGKWLELLKEIAPRVNRIAALFNPASAPYRDLYLNPFKVAAASFAVEAIVAPVDDMVELESLVRTQARESNGGLVVIPDAFTELHVAEIASLSIRYRLPAIDWSRSFAENGGLISYGLYLVDEYRRGATYVDRVLKGEKPSQLPVQAPLKFQLVINLKTAKALDLTVPQTLRVAADELIE